MRRMFHKYHRFRDTEEKIGLRLNFMFLTIRKTKYSEPDLSEVRGQRPQREKFKQKTRPGIASSLDFIV